MPKSHVPTDHLEENVDSGRYEEEGEDDKNDYEDELPAQDEEEGDEEGDDDDEEGESELPRAPKEEEPPERESPATTNQTVAHSQPKMNASRSMTSAAFVRTLNRTTVQLPVAIKHGVDYERNNSSKTAVKFTPRDTSVSPFTPRPLTNVISITPKVTILNSKVNPLKFSGKGNQSVLISKKTNDPRNNRLKIDEKTTEKVKFGRSKRDIAHYSSVESDYNSSHDGDYSGTPAPSESLPAGDANRDYDDYEYSAKTERRDHEPDAYDIHGYKSQTSPPGKMEQPAYLIAQENNDQSSSELTSRRPATFKSPKRKKKKKNNRGKNRKGATSSVSISMKGEHHHHHFYDDLKETHENPPESYVHSPHFLVPKLPPEIYKKYPGKHKHFHHIRRPGDPPLTIPKDSDEDDESFDEETLTDKDHEEAYKTYDEDVIVNDEGEVDPDAPQRPADEGVDAETTIAPVAAKPRAGKYRTVEPARKLSRPLRKPSRKRNYFQQQSSVALKVSSLKSKKSKEEVDRIFDTVERAMRDPALNVPLPPSADFEPHWNLNFHPIPR